jgi:hypothetical protein
MQRPPPAEQLQHGEPLIGVGRRAGEVVQPAQPVPHRVGVHVERRRRLVEPLAVVEVGERGRREFAVERVGRA